MSDIAKTFSQIVKDLRSAASQEEVNHKTPIDVELTFEKVKITNRGFLVAKKSDREDLKIKIATSITVS